MFIFLIQKKNKLIICLFEFFNVECAIKKKIQLIVRTIDR